MTEFKTLKDFEPEDAIVKGRIDFGISARELRKEAIKWIKLCCKDLNETNIKEEIMFLNGEIFAFEHFFNLTENLK